MSSTYYHPAHIFIGSPTKLVDTANEFLRHVFCANAGCGVCTICYQIRNQQFYATTWLTPERQYSLDDLKPIFNTISYALNQNEHHFFIIQQAELLTPACSNSLLKIVEEPPTGYHFMFLTNRLHSLLPTIRSRCIVHGIAQPSSSETSSSLLACFQELGIVSPAAFLKIFDQEKIHEAETMMLMDDLLVYWGNKSREALQEHPTSVRGEHSRTIEQAQNMIGILHKALEEPPMPGSSKIFWRNLFLQVSAIRHSDKNSEL